MAYSELNLFSNKKRHDYDIEAITDISVPHKFSIIIRAFSDCENIIRYLLDFYSSFDNFFEVFLSLDTPGYDIKRIMTLFPNIHIIQFVQKKKLYSTLNAYSKIVKSDYFIFIDDTLTIKELDFNFLDKVFHSYKKPVCISPLILTKDMDVFANIRIPSLRDSNRVEVNLSFPTSCIENTLYPISGIGVYDRKRLIDVGTFPPLDDYYCILQFFIKSWCLGYSCTFSDSFALLCTSIDEHIEVIETTGMETVNLRTFSFKKEGLPAKKINLSQFLSFGYNNIKKSYDSAADFIYDYNMLVKNWILYEDECLQVLNEG